MLTIAPRRRQTLPAVTLLPGCLLAVEGSGRALFTFITRRAGPGEVTFAGQETRGDAEFFDDLHHLAGREWIHPFTTPRLHLTQLAEEEGEPESAEMALAFFGLGDWRDRPVWRMPPHLRQRLRLARLVAQRRLIWLLDRPFYGLDEEGAAMLEALVASRCQSHGIVLLAGPHGRLNPHHRLS